ncbi:hypothetical protein BGS_0756 [Beggiatoa sp. SS]|nr:hypothetical protein BGS_0756 [Beggiatoa sp. SS]
MITSVQTDHGIERIDEHDFNIFINTNQFPSLEIYMWPKGRENNVRTLRRQKTQRCSTFDSNAGAVMSDDRTISTRQPRSDKYCTSLDITELIAVVREDANTTT